MTPEEHYAQGEGYLREAEANNHSAVMATRDAAIAQAHFLAAMAAPLELAPIVHVTDPGWTPEKLAGIKALMDEAGKGRGQL